MKKLLLLLAACAVCSISAASAATIRVRVQDFKFSPATVNAVVGDVIQWQWVNGHHTTTSTSVPTGARAWNKQLSSTATTFRYRIQVAGTYQYQCNFHVAQGMVGTINVTAGPHRPADGSTTR